MDRYHITATLGDGTYGSVVKAVYVPTGEIVAIKHMKAACTQWNAALKSPEVTSLRRLNHPNIVKLREVILEKSGDLFFVFEYLDVNLYEAIKERAESGKHFSEITVRNILWQILQALAYMHRTHFHRDLKPENCLVRSSATATLLAAKGHGFTTATPTSSGDITVKIADFGLAKEIRSRPPYTDYVSTRWYRAPEILLRFPSYSSAIDMFALGCIAAEMYNLSPLLPGASEVDQLNRMTQLLGTPNASTWSAGVKQAATLGFKWAYHAALPLASVIPSASSSAISLIAAMLEWDPMKRITAAQALAHPYFSDAISVPRAFPPCGPEALHVIETKSGRIKATVDWPPSKSTSDRSQAKTNTDIPSVAEISSHFTSSARYPQPARGTSRAPQSSSAAAAVADTTDDLDIETLIAQYETSRTQK